MMKQVLILFLLAAMVSSCKIKNRARKDSLLNETEKAQLEMLRKDSTTVKVIDSLFNFGKIKQGDVVEHKFYFVNTGKKLLVFPINPKTSCGCTVSEKPDKPIMPGDTSFIKVVFNSKGKSNHVVKSVIVYSNAVPEFPSLILTGDIESTN
jgi:hypothetical protein